MYSFAYSDEEQFEQELKRKRGENKIKLKVQIDRAATSGHQESKET